MLYGCACARLFAWASSFHYTMINYTRNFLPYFIYHIMCSHEKKTTVAFHLLVGSSANVLHVIFHKATIQCSQVEKMIHI